MDSSEDKEINILLLGETGVGKSTFINGFANYLNYETMAEAENGQPICLIPTKFVVTDAHYKRQDVSYGYDTNESYEKEGESVTQNCRAYTFTCGEILIRLIDTPGVGDTRGFEQDKINFDNILLFIAEYEKLHLICILMKPDMTRLTHSFQYCLKQLLCHLQKDASENMVFLFTNTRSTFYRPKNTLVLLESILDEIKTRPPFVIIPIELDTMYCLDNDSFQFLIALRNGITFDNSEKDVYALSWTKSVSECKRLINYITSGRDGKPLPPHSIQNTLSINETRRLIVALNKPIAKIAENIEKNLKESAETKKKVENFTGNIQHLVEELKTTEYKDEGSFWDYVPIVNIFTILTKRAEAEKAHQKQDQLRKELTDITSNKKIKEDLLKQLEQVTDEYKQERELIVKSSAKFAYFLKTNAIAAYNDSYKDCLLEQIDSAEKSGAEKNIIDNLKKLLDDYENEKSILEKNINLGCLEETDLSVSHINSLIEDLYKLKVTGDEIKKLHEMSKSKQCDDVKDEVVHKVEHAKSNGFFKSVRKWITFTGPGKNSDK